jgi:hypothetical protein
MAMLLVGVLMILENYNNGGLKWKKY